MKFDIKLQRFSPTEMMVRNRMGKYIYIDEVIKLLKKIELLERKLEEKNTQLNKKQEV